MIRLALPLALCLPVAASDHPSAHHAASPKEAKAPHASRPSDSELHRIIDGRFPGLYERYKRILREPGLDGQARRGLTELVEAVGLYLRNEALKGRPEYKREVSKAAEALFHQGMSRMAEGSQHGRLMREFDPLLRVIMAPEELLEHVHSSLNPKTPIDWKYWAQTELQSGSPQKAIEAANKALQLGPDDAEALTLRAGARYRLGDFSGAYQDAVVALSLEPQNATALSIVKLYEGRAALDDASVPRELRQPAEPAGDADSAPPASSTDPGPRLREAAVAIRLKDYAAAHRRLDAAISLDPSNAQAFVLRAAVRLKQGRHVEALDDTDAALRLGARGVDVLNTRALALNRLSRFADAEATAREALKMSAGDPRLWFNVAFAANGRNDRKSTLLALQRAASSDPVRYRPLYERAFQSPAAADLSFLFNDGPAFPQPPAEGGARRGPSLWLVLAATVSGGMLIAAGVVRAALRSAAARPSSRAGAYSIGRKIGVGGMGVVYEGLDTQLGRRVAIKQMREEIRDDPGQRERFLKEARIVAGLQHPNIVAIYAIAEEGEEIYMVLEFIEGRSLAEILAEKERLAWVPAMSVLRDACRALEYAHGRQVVHRDIKPGNIMVASCGTAKLMDFGIARWKCSAATTQVAGTPRYMAPEQEQGRAEPASDLYALAACFYEMLTGRPPFEGEGPGLSKAKMEGRYPPPSVLVGGLPRGFDEVLGRALDPEPSKRWASAMGFLEAVEAL